MDGLANTTLSSFTGVLILLLLSIIVVRLYFLGYFEKIIFVGVYRLKLEITSESHYSIVSGIFFT